MPKLPLRIEIVRSHSKIISSMGELSAASICRTLSEHYESVVVSNVDTVEDIQALIARRPDLVFAGIYSMTDEATGETIWLTDELEKHDIRYTGSSKEATLLSRNKHLAKQRLAECDIDTAAFKLARRDDSTTVTEGSLRFPLFVKPTNKSGGQGIDAFSVVRNRQQLCAKVQEIHEQHATDALIEEYLEGREFSIGIIGNEGTAELTAAPIEMIAGEDENGERMLGKSVKKENIEQTIVVSDPEEQRNLKAFGIESFRALGAKDFGRIDVRLDGNGKIHFLEANLIPGLKGNDSYFPKSLRFNTSINYETMLLRIVTLALTRGN